MQLGLFRDVPLCDPNSSSNTTSNASSNRTIASNSSSNATSNKIANATSNTTRWRNTQPNFTTLSAPDNEDFRLPKLPTNRLGLCSSR